MKKYLMSLLVLGMALSLSACGKSNDVKEPDNPQTDDSNLNQGNNNNQDLTPVFDNSWASNDFEMQIPEPFFTVVEAKWTVENAVYMISGEQHTENTSLEALNAYVDELRFCGFNALESEYNFLGEGSMYAFSAWNSTSGYGVYVQYDEITQEEISQLMNGMTPGPAVFIIVFDCHKELTGTSLPEVAYSTYLDAQTEIANNN